MVPVPDSQLLLREEPPGRWFWPAEMVQAGEADAATFVSTLGRSLTKVRLLPMKTTLSFLLAVWSGQLVLSGPEARSGPDPASSTA